MQKQELASDDIERIRDDDNLDTISDPNEFSRTNRDVITERTENTEITNPHLQSHQELYVDSTTDLYSSVGGGAHNQSMQEPGP